MFRPTRSSRPSTDVFYDVPVRNPGTLAFAPIVDGDVVPDYPVKLAREGRTHPVPLIIGTNKHEAALFKWMKSPLMPITPEAINAMFTEIAAEQPTCNCPPRTRSAPPTRGLRGKARGMGVARDVGFRMPSVWLAEGHSAVAPVYLYRFDFATPMLELLRIARRPRHRIALRLGQSRHRPQGPDVQAGRAQDRRGGLGADPDPLAELRDATANRPACPASRSGRPTATRPRVPAHRQAGRRRRRHRHAYPRHLGHRGAQLPVAGRGLARICPGGVAVDWAKAWEHVLPPLMHDPVTFAVPFFLVLLVIEWAAARKLAHTEDERRSPRGPT